MTVCPFIVLVVLILSRHHFFDDWHWTWPLTIVVASVVCYPLYQALTLQLTAVRARKHILLKLRDIQVRFELGVEMARKEESEGDGTRAQPASRIIEAIENLRIGAFAGLGQNPILIAVLIPFAGAGLCGLIEYYLTRYWY